MAAGTEKRWYLGTGQEFVKAQCREYKTLEGALKAAAKNPDFVVWDENGNVVGSLTDDVPEGTENAQTAAGTPTDSTESAKGAEADENTPEAEKDADGENTDEQESDAAAGASGEGDETAAGAYTDGADSENGAEADENTQEAGKDDDGADTSAQGGDVIIPDGEMRVTVVCDGSLNLRRSAEWGNDNICGRATRGQQYHVKAIHTVEGKKMVETIDGLYLSGNSAHVQFEQM